MSIYTSVSGERRPGGMTPVALEESDGGAAASGSGAERDNGARRDRDKGREIEHGDQARRVKDRLGWRSSQEMRNFENPYRRRVA